MDEYIYCFKINPCVYESAAMTLSIHKTKIGAYMARKQYLLNRYERLSNAPKKHRVTIPIGHDERYFIERVKLKD